MHVLSAGVHQYGDSQAVLKRDPRTTEHTNRTLHSHVMHAVTLVPTFPYAAMSCLNTAQYYHEVVPNLICGTQPRNPTDVDILADTEKITHILNVCGKRGTCTAMGPCAMRSLVCAVHSRALPATRDGLGCRHTLGCNGSGCVGHTARPVVFGCRSCRPCSPRERADSREQLSWRAAFSDEQRLHAART